MFKKNLVILLTGFVDYLGVGLIYPIFATLLFDRTFLFLPESTSDAMRGFYLGTLLALMPLMQVFFSPILGKLSDQKGRKSVLAATVLLSLLGYLIAAFGIIIKSLTCLFIYRILLGIAAGNAAVAQAAMVDKVNEKNNSKNFSLFNMAIGAGYTIGPFLGGFLSEPNIFFKGSYLTTFGFASITSFINLYLILKFYQEGPAERQKNSSSFFSELTDMKKVLNFKGAKAVILCMFTFSFGWSFLFEFIPVFLIHRYEFSSSQIGNFYGFSGAFYAISCAFLIHPILKKFSFSKILLISFLASGLYSFMFLMIKNPSFIWLYIPFLVYLIALIYPTLSILTSVNVEAKNQGQALGGLIAVQSLAYALSPLFSGFIVGLYHQTPILLAGTSFLLSGLIFGYYYLRGYLEPGNLGREVE